MNLYAFEKLKELEQELADKRRLLRLDPRKPRGKPIFGSAAATAGRTLRRFGEGLESWANRPVPDSDRGSPQAGC